MFYTAILALSVIYVLSLFVDKVLKGKNSNNGKQRYTLGTHVIISGGSKGIGKSLGKKFAELGTHVTIIARNESDLQAAKIEIEKYRKKRDVQKVRTVSLDLTKVKFSNNSNSEIDDQHRDLLEKILGEHERCDVLINCCGSAVSGRFDDISQEQFHQMMDVNYFSAVNLTRILLPAMKARSLSTQNGSRPGGSRIVFVSSIGGLLSFYGYSAYSASKFALVGLAEALHMELKPFDIGVTISFPPDTDTPGFKEENKTKPRITSKISESGNVFSPDDVAISIVNDIRAKKFYSTIGLENWAILTTSNTFMPTTPLSSVIISSFLAGPLKIAGFFILKSWYKLVEEATPNEIINAEIAMKCSKNVKYDDTNQAARQSN